jgi:hypothetical protein
MAAALARAIGNDGLSSPPERVIRRQVRNPPGEEPIKGPRAAPARAFRGRVLMEAGRGSTSRGNRMRESPDGASAPLLPGKAKARTPFPGNPAAGERARKPRRTGDLN